MTIPALRQRLTRRVQRSVRAKQLSMRLVEDRLERSRGFKPNWCKVSASSKTSSKDRAAEGLMVSSYLTLARSSLRVGGLGLGPGTPQSPHRLPLLVLG